MKRTKKSRVLMAKVLLVVTSIFGVVAAYQFIMYHKEGGVFVADKYTSPPASKVIYYRGKPLSEAVVSTQKIGNISRSGERTYHQEPLMSWTEKWAYWNAIRKFPTLEKCLLPSGQKTKDLSQFAWGSMRTSHQVKVCLFHLAAQIKEPQKIMAWAEEQGFSTASNQSSRCYMIKNREKKGCTALSAVWRRTGETIDSPYSFFSTQTLLEQYTLWSLLLGHSGLPEWKISMNEEQQAFSIRIRNSPNK